MCWELGVTTAFILKEIESKNGGSLFHLVGESYIESRAWHEPDIKDNKNDLQVVGIM